MKSKHPTTLKQRQEIAKQGMESQYRNSVGLGFRKRLARHMAKNGGETGQKSLATNEVSE